MENDKDENKIDRMRHSASHLLAAAVMKLWPETKLGIGPTIENGFYYDFSFKKPVSEDDLSKIEKEMRNILKTWDGFTRIEKSISEAKKLEKNQPFKLDLIKEFSKTSDKVSFYKSGDFIDLCKGGHVRKAKEIGHFRLLSVAGAYWRGSENNPMLTRIYGTVWPTKKGLDQYLSKIEEAKEWGHRKIGKELGLFVFSDVVGKGLPLFTAKGAAIRRVLERFITDEEIKRGYEHVVTPHLAKTELYRISGHYPYYKDTMYPPMKIDEEELILRPMTCPHHFMLYRSQPRSYKELPIRYAEIASQFRYEKSGELTGLMRVRVFHLADAHIFVTKEQAKGVVKEVLDLIDYTNDVLGLKRGEDYRYRLSLGDRSERKKYYNDDKSWEKAEKILHEVLMEVEAPFFVAKDEAAFYGPKIDIQMKNAGGKEETAFTVQYDFVSPKRFNLSYIDEKGKKEDVVVIHRSSIGAIERTMAFLIEKYKGAFPVWFSPIQAIVIPIADRHSEYAKEIKNKLVGLNIRAQVDSRSETMQAKIRDAQLQKIPYMIVLGDKEMLQKKVNIRSRDRKYDGFISFNDFLDHLKKEIAEYK